MSQHARDDSPVEHRTSPESLPAGHQPSRPAEADPKARLAEAHRQLADHLENLKPQISNVPTEPGAEKPPTYKNRYEQLKATVDELLKKPNPSGLSSDEALAVHAYAKGGIAEPMNRVARLNEGDVNRDGHMTPEDLLLADHLTTAVNAGLAKLPNYEGPSVRRINFGEGNYFSAQLAANHYRLDEIVVEPSFLSTTMHRPGDNDPTFQGQIEFRIQSRTAKDVTSLSPFKSEREALFPPRTQFAVTGKTFDRARSMWIINLDEVVPGDPRHLTPQEVEEKAAQRRRQWQEDETRSKEVKARVDEVLKAKNEAEYAEHRPSMARLDGLAANRTADTDNSTPAHEPTANRDTSAEPPKPAPDHQEPQSPDRAQAKDPATDSQPGKEQHDQQPKPAPQSNETVPSRITSVLDRPSGQQAQDNSASAYEPAAEHPFPTEPSHDRVTDHQEQPAPDQHRAEGTPEDSAHGDTRHRQDPELAPDGTQPVRVDQELLEPTSTGHNSGYDFAPLFSATNPPWERALHAATTVHENQQVKYLSERFPEIFGTNENFYHRYAEANGATTNCTRCVVAFEQRLNGVDAKAEPVFPHEVDTKGTLDYVEQQLGARRLRHPHYDSVIRYMNDQPDGARAAIGIKWRPDPGKEPIGHVATVVKTAEGVAFIDPQSARLLTLPPWPLQIDLIHYHPPPGGVRWGPRRGDNLTSSGGPTTRALLSDT